VKICVHLGSSAAVRMLPFALLLASVEAKPDKEPVVTPSFAKPVKAVVFIGGEVGIPLLANAPVRSTKYFIRSQPGMGVLGEILTTEDGRATVLYRHDPLKGMGTDTFSYAVQSPGAAVSSRATVSVEVINRPPHLEFPSEVDFGDVPVGTSTRKLVTLGNSGGEPFVGRVQLPSCWDSPVGRLEIPAAREFDLPVEFKPDAARAYEGTLYIEGGVTPVGITLRGTGYAVLDVSPPFLKLQSSQDGVRSGKLMLSNKTEEPISIDFDCSPGLLPIPPVALGGGAKAEVEIRADGARVSGGRTALIVREKRVSATIEVLIPPLPAKLLFDPASALDFGQIQPGKSAVRELTITNAGGIPAAVEIACPTWILSDATRLLVRPAERTVLRIEAAATRPGTLRDRMLFKYDDKSVEIIVSATVPAAQATPAATPAAPPPAQTINLAETKKEALRVTRISQNEGFVTVGWQDPNPDPRTYLIELQRISSEASLARQAAIAPEVGTEFSPEQVAAERLKFTKLFELADKNDKVVKTWVPLEKAEVTPKENTSFEVSFPVPPRQPVIRIRISSVLPDGTVSPIQTEIRIPLKQPPARHWPVKTIFFWLVGLTALAVLARKFIR